jgi:hypothetical protein
MIAKARLPILSDHEKACATSLGMAVAYQWRTLPDSVQALLLDQACVVDVPPMGKQLREALELFVRTDRSGE